MFKFKGVWNVIDEVDGVASKARTVRMEADVESVNEAFDMLRSVALETACDHNGVRSTIQTLDGYLYEGDEYVARIPLMYGAWYAERGYFCDNRNAAYWPVN